MTIWTLYIHRRGSWRKIGSCRRCTQEENSMTNNDQPNQSATSLGDAPQTTPAPVRQNPGGGGAGGGCPKCEEHKQAVIDAMSVANDLCEQREAIIEKLMSVCYDEANRIASHCSDGAGKWAMNNLYDAANHAKAYLARVRVGAVGDDASGALGFLVAR